MNTPKTIAALAIDAAEAAIVLGARALCAAFAVAESPRQNTHVDPLYADAMRPVPPPLYYREHFADCTTETAPDASPEAPAGQPLASGVPHLTDDDYDSIAFACRAYAGRVPTAAQPYWMGIADRAEAQK